MIPKVRAKTIFTSFVIASAVSLYAPVPFAPAQSAEASAAQAASASEPSLDYEFFKTRVEPIFLKKRSPDHGRCYVCHHASRFIGRALHLEPLLPGMSFWTEEQSQRNFQTVSNFVITGAPLSSILLLKPLAPEAGGLADTHQGGRQFASQDDPDWKTMAAWVRGQKEGGSSDK
jgi:hypothetical protein